MKIVCPCCDQEYDVDENLLNIELECSELPGVAALN